MNSRYMMKLKPGLCQNFGLLVLLISISGFWLPPPREKLFWFMLSGSLSLVLCSW